MFRLLYKIFFVVTLFVLPINSFSQQPPRDCLIDEQGPCVNNFDIGSEYHNEKGILEVKISGEWKSVCCISNDLVISNQSCVWDIRPDNNRRLRDLTNNRELRCLEAIGNPNIRDCDCSNGLASGEAMHGEKQIGSNRNVEYTIESKYGGDCEGGKIYPDHGQGRCVNVNLANNELFTHPSDSTCPKFRHRKLRHEVLDHLDEVMGLDIN